MMTWISRKLIALLTIGLLATPSLALQAPAETDPHKSKLLSYLLRQQLSTNHFSPKELDDTFSQAAFDLYLKQLDFQKRFLLKKDVVTLQAYATRIDEELHRGVFDLPVVSAALVRERVAEVREMVRTLVAGPVDLNRQEKFQADPEKFEFSATPQELRERWRQIITFQVLTRYLNLEEDEATSGKKSSSAERLQIAREKVGKTFEDFFTRMLEEKDQDYYDRYFNAVTRAHDPHTNYLPPMQKEDFDIGMSGSLEGIGATLKEEDGFIKVVAIIPGSPAYLQGQLQPEDVILKVAEKTGDPVDITDTRIRDAVSLIRGKKGTEVRLTVKKADGASLVIPIIRDVVQIEESFVKSSVITSPNGGRSFGYIHIPTFYRDFKSPRDGGTGRNSTDDVKAELRQLKAKNTDGLILDLRDNGGGALTDAVSIAGLFFKSGPVVQVKSGDGRIQVLADDDAAIHYSGPLVVLVNQFSASASEILAGALQDYGRAIIIGSEHTHGKGTVQAIIDLDRSVPFRNMDQYKPLGALKLTTQKFYRVSGESTQYRGVVPDIVLPDRLGHLKSGEQYLDYSLPWDSVASTRFEPWTGLANTDLSLIKSRSQQRIAVSTDFRQIAADAATARQKQENTLQSLNLEEIRRERAEAKLLLEKSSRTMHGNIEMPGEERKPLLTPEERRAAWEKKVKEDPYT
ncbi:MAG: carboxy terminal-processing peptidase, partial [Desulfuromonadales bacterium]|nr:carboxy terminal-processing peptidase [Desulfuromonadales bacterium]